MTKTTTKLLTLVLSFALIAVLILPFGTLTANAAASISESVTGNDTITCSTDFANGYTGTFETAGTGLTAIFDPSGSYSGCSYISTSKISISGNASYSYSPNATNSYNFTLSYSSGKMTLSCSATILGMGTSKIAGTLNLTAKTPATTYYTVTFNLAGGSRTGGGATSQSIASGSSATAPTVTRSGYTFNGWDKSFSNVTSNLTVTAKWTANPVYYTVTFDLAGGSRTGGGQLSQSVASGSAATAPTATKEGYTLTGWSRTFNNVTSNITVSAVWEVKMLTVTLIIPNQEPIVLSVAYGTTITTALTEMNAVAEDFNQLTVQGVVYSQFDETAGLYADSYFSVTDELASEEPSYFVEWLMGIVAVIISSSAVGAISARIAKKKGDS